jgi:hypothetical protein
MLCAPTCLALRRQTGGHITPAYRRSLGIRLDSIAASTYPRLGLLHPRQRRIRSRVDSLPTIAVRRPLAHFARVWDPRKLPLLRHVCAANSVGHSSFEARRDRSLVGGPAQQCWPAAPPSSYAANSVGHSSLEPRRDRLACGRASPFAYDPHRSRIASNRKRTHGAVRRRRSPAVVPRWGRDKRSPSWPSRFPAARQLESVYLVADSKNQLRPFTEDHETGESLRQ